MINLHCHTYFSDGILGPAELLTRCIKKRYRAVALTDHIDESNFENVLKNVKKVTDEFNKSLNFRALCGAELTYVLPKNIDKIAKECRKLGAEIIVVHGETLVEPVPEETNIYAAQSKNIDIIAHPGLICSKSVKYAKKNNISLEITSRKGHSLSNGYVANIAQQYDINMVISTDAHCPEDLIDENFAMQVLIGAGLTKKSIINLWKNMIRLAGLK